MKKSTIGIFVGIGISILAITLIPGLVKYLVPPVDTPSAEPVYYRVEAQKYEIVFPLTVNSEPTYGYLRWGASELQRSLLSGAFEFSDEYCDDDGYFVLGFKIYADETLGSSKTLSYYVAEGEYGRYVISENQEWDEPVAYTFEPIYEYVLVE